MNEVITTTASLAGNFFGGLVLGLIVGWGACLWRNRNRPKADAIEAAIRDAADGASNDVRVALAQLKGVIIREKAK